MNVGGDKARIRCAVFHQDPEYQQLPDLAPRQHPYNLNYVPGNAKHPLVGVGIGSTFKFCIRIERSFMTRTLTHPGDMKSEKCKLARALGPHILRGTVSEFIGLPT